MALLFITPQVSGPAGGPPGTWELLGEGSSRIDVAATLTVLTAPVDPADTTLFVVTPEDVAGGGPNAGIYAPDVATFGTSSIYFSHRVGPNVLFRIANFGGIPMNYRWKAYKVR